MNVLFVDDEIALAELLKDFAELTFPEVNFFVAADGAKAIEIQKQYDCKLVFTDANMGEVSGLQLCQMLKESDPDVKVILLSGNIDRDIAPIFDGKLPKPFSHEEFLNYLRSFIAKE